MGNKVAKLSLKDKDISRLVERTRFQEDEVRALLSQFVHLKAPDSDSTDLHISLAEFQASLGLKSGQSSLFLERVFKLLARSTPNAVSFEEFLIGLSNLTPNATPEARFRFTFAIYDYDGNGYITPENLKMFLSAAMTENDVLISENDVEMIVKETFASLRLQDPKRISYDEYVQMVVKQPSILKPLTFNLQELIANHPETQQHAVHAK
jgi:Ca2+-binding EF-hand superfamily protein